MYLCTYVCILYLSVHRVEYVAAVGGGDDLSKTTGGGALYIYIYSWVMSVIWLLVEEVWEYQYVRILHLA